MGEVVELPCLTTLPIPVERVCERAKDSDEVLILGFKDGEFVAACSNTEVTRLVFIANKFIHKAMRGDYTDES